MHSLLHVSVFRAIIRESLCHLKLCPSHWSVMWVTVTHKHLLTPWCRVLLEKLTGLQLVKKFPPFHGTRRFITALTSVRHLSVSWASPIQSTYPHPTSWRSTLKLSTHLRLGLPSGSSPPVSPPRPYTPPLLTHTRHMPSPSLTSTRNKIWLKTQEMPHHRMCAIEPLC